MAVIAFVMDIEEGHIIPSLALASALRERGHQVFYISVPDNQKRIVAHGFEFYPVLSEVYPTGYNDVYKKSRGEAGYTDPAVKDHFTGIMERSFDAVLRDKRPDLLVISAFLSLEALLLHYLYKIKTVIFTPFLRRPDKPLVADCLDHVMKLPADTICGLTDFLVSIGVPFSSLRDLLAPLASFAELVACPAEMQLEKAGFSANCHFIEPCIRQEEELNGYQHPGRPGSPVIYAALGSQAASYGDTAAAFYRQLLDVMSSPAMKHLHLVLVAGDEAARILPDSIPENVTIAQWVPQLSVLKIASLVITHGGLGTIKECIYHGVPMIVVPFKYDQPRNAAIVADQQLGVSMKATDVTADTLHHAIIEVMNNDIVRARIGAMQAVFRAHAVEKPGVHLIEKILQ